MSDRPELGTRRPGRPRDARADLAIIDATVDLLGKEGFGGVTVEAVATQAGVGKATIYRRWPTKEALLLEAASTLARPPDVADTGEVRADLLALLGHIAASLRGTVAGSLLPDLVGEAGRNPEMARLMGDLTAQRREPLRTVLERAVERGQVRPGLDLDVVGDTIVGALLHRHLVTHAPLDGDVTVAIVDTVLGGIAAR